jgi:acyl-[acyl carrier protein]--UDP-N-acetylglucosamine O-acyltransferase
VRIREIHVEEICNVLGLPYSGNNERITGLIKLVRFETKADSLITFCGNAGMLPEILSNPKIKALITKSTIYSSNETILKTMPIIVSESPMESFYLLHQHLFEKTPFYNEYDFPREIGADCSIHPSSAIEDGVKIGNRVRIGPFSYIRKGTTISDDCTIDANTVIGGDGFEVKVINGIRRIIPHCGGVRIERNVEIGSGCVIDKSMFEGATIIGENTKIDNLVQIAHNCIVGKDVLICANVQLSGSVTIGDACYLAPSVSVRDQVSIVGDAFIGIGAVVTKQISECGTYVGIPARRIAKAMSGAGL